MSTFKNMSVGGENDTLKRGAEGALKPRGQVKQKKRKKNITLFNPICQKEE